MKSNVRQIKD